MKFADHLNREQIQEFNRIRKKSKSHYERVTVTSPGKKERLSKREWEEIMGKNRDIYIRVSGSLRRK